MKKWINVVWTKYAHFKLKRKNILVLDETSMLKNITEIKKSLELSKSKVMMIPGGLTRYLQPLDFSNNKSFKDGIRKKYNQY